MWTLGTASDFFSSEVRPSSESVYSPEMKTVKVNLGGKAGCSQITCLSYYCSRCFFSMLQFGVCVCGVCGSI